MVILLQTKMARGVVQQEVMEEMQTVAVARMVAGAMVVVGLELVVMEEMPAAAAAVVILAVAAGTMETALQITEAEPVLL